VKSLEESLLSRPEQLLKQAIIDTGGAHDVNAARLAVLEEAAAVYAGWPAAEYRDVIGAPPADPASTAGAWAQKILNSLVDLPIPVPLALSGLSREVVDASRQRTTGAYHTDWRLALMLSAECVPRAEVDGLWVDPACGSGMLLTAAALQVPAGEQRERVLRSRICGADLSGHALRGTSLSLAALTSDLSTVASLRSRLFQQDSLRSADLWTGLAPNGVALVIANPPWERLKVTRHEVAARQGITRRYGESHEVEVDLSAPRAELLAYVDEVASGSRLQGSGERDLYKLFLELGLGLAAEKGILAMLLPAGLIRSQGTEMLRRELFALAHELSVSVLENRQRHFAIDTRFKFVSVVARVGGGSSKPLVLRVADRAGSLPRDPVLLPRDALQRARPDLSLPEVRNRSEWKIFEQLTGRGVRVGNPTGPWRPDYRREVDMTNDRQHFRRAPTESCLPLVEGRHVGQFRSRAKRYVSGEGRSARWTPERLGSAALVPQWYIDPNRLQGNTRARTAVSRIGFCDITGQTNERTLLVARIPSGTVCGNKVPTLSFPAGGADREDLFLALANTLVVDWVLRRLVTTTVNFFLLDSLPLPDVDSRSAAGRELIDLARRVTLSETDPSTDPWQIGRWRARIDALAAREWDLSLHDLQVVLSDFPLLDRGQPTLEGESRSTITTDFVLAAFLEAVGEQPGAFDTRVMNAKRMGAIPYVPAEYT
jgi:hypothetical protein